MPVNVFLALTPSKELSEWIAYFAVRAEKQKEREDDDGETYHWGSPREDGDD